MKLNKKYIGSMAYSKTMDKPILVCEKNIPILLKDGLKNLFNVNTNKKPSKSNRSNSKGVADASSS